MYAAGHAYDLLSGDEVETIHRQALLILARMGMEIENEQLLRVLREFGLTVDMDSERVRFPSVLVEDFLEKSVKYEWTARDTKRGGVGRCLPRSLSRPSVLRASSLDRGPIALLFSAGE